MTETIKVPDGPMTLTLEVGAVNLSRWELRWIDCDGNSHQDRADVGVGIEVPAGAKIVGCGAIPEQDPPPTITIGLASA